MIVSHYQQKTDISKIDYLNSKSLDSVQKDKKRSNGFSTSEFRAIRGKTEDEIIFLENQFQIDPTWNRRTVQICRKTLGLRTDQVYKWGYDKKKQIEKAERGAKRLENVSDQSLTKWYQNEFLVTDYNLIVANIIKQLEDGDQISEMKVKNLNEFTIEAQVIKRIEQKKSNLLDIKNVNIDSQNCWDISNTTTIRTSNSSPYLKDQSFGKSNVFNFGLDDELNNRLDLFSGDIDTNKKENMLLGSRQNELLQRLDSEINLEQELYFFDQLYE